MPLYRDSHSRISSLFSISDSIFALFWLPHPRVSTLPAALVDNENPMYTRTGEDPAAIGHLELSPSLGPKSDDCTVNCGAEGHSCVPSWCRGCFRMLIKTSGCRNWPVVKINRGRVQANSTPTHILGTSFARPQALLLPASSRVLGWKVGRNIRGQRPRDL